MRAACGKRVQPEPAASQFRKHSLLTNYALGLACGGLRRPAVVSMRRYVRNTKSADAVVPMVLDKPNACQRSDCAESGSGTTLSSFALSRQELEKMDLKLCRFKVRFSSPTLEMFPLTKLNFVGSLKINLWSLKLISGFSRTRFLASPRLVCLTNVTP